MRSVLQAILCLSLLAATLPAAAQNLEFARQDPAKIETAEKCGECHVSEYEVWKKTPHATGFKTLHRKGSAETIARKSLAVAAEICIYTNDKIVVESLEAE